MWWWWVWGGREGGDSNVKQLTEAAHWCWSRWGEGDAEAYLRFTDMVRMVRLHQDWALDVSWLLGQGVAIPPKLQQYGVQGWGCNGSGRVVNP